MQYPPVGRVAVLADIEARDEGRAEGPLGRDEELEDVLQEYMSYKSRA